MNNFNSRVYIKTWFKVRKIKWRVNKILLTRYDMLVNSKNSTFNV